MSNDLAKEPQSGLTPVQWLVCIIAAIGFAFDIYELLMLPLVIRPALQELAGIQPGTPEFATWFGRLFYIPAFAGGIFGLLGGYLTDLLGRRRVLTWSILLYAFSAFAAGFSTNLWMLLFFRCTTFIGVCIEFVAAVAWLAELFPEPKRRETVLGQTQAFSSIGGLLVAIVNGMLLDYLTRHPQGLPYIGLPNFLNFFGGEITDHYAAWRYTLMSGLIPALPLIVIRPFLPESPTWQAKRQAGTLKRPSILELFAPRHLRTTIVTTVMFACSYGAAFGAIQHIPQIVPGLPEVKQAREGKPVPEQKKIEQKFAADYTKVQEVGGLLGRFLLAYLAVRIVSRRLLLRIFQIPGLFLMPLIFIAFALAHNQTLFTVHLEWLFLGAPKITWLSLGILIAGLVTVAQFSFWGNYLPRVYPVHLRGTGESFAANIGGRMIGTSFAYVTSTLAAQSWMIGGSPPAKTAFTAAAVAFFVFAVGSLACFFLPEPGPEEAHD